MTGEETATVAGGPTPERRTYGLDRLGALSDGVFAIALTLLVLELKVPDVPAGEAQILANDLSRLVPKLLAWVVSFALLARFWAIHHDVIASMRACRIGTIGVNFVVLALASLVPFASALIGTYEFALGSMVIFSATVVGTGVSLGLLSRHVEGRPGLRREKMGKLHWHWRYNAIILPLIGFLAVGFAWITHPAAALGVWILEPVVALLLFYRRA